MTILLASGSPRRRILLQWAGYLLEVRPSHVDETRDPRVDPLTHAQDLAKRKLAAIPTDPTVGWPGVALAADTLVHFDGQIFEKPRDRAEAIRHLERLSGRWHAVTTGVAVRGSAYDTVFAVTTQVRFRDLQPAEILAYVASGEADDKAGAYGIQGRAAVFVAEVRGSWTNVVGLPMEATIAALTAAGATRGSH